MTSTPRAVWDAIDAAKRNRQQAWSWRSTDDPRRFEIWRHGESVGMLTVLPGHIERRAVLLDTIVTHLNKENTQ